MRDRSHDDAGEGHVPGDVIAERLAFVRRDIGDLITEQRTQFAELDRRIHSIATKVAQIEVERAREDGKLSGVKMTLGLIFTVGTALGGALTWIITHLPWGQPKP